jgi:hypothetical protein
VASDDQQGRRRDRRQIGFSQVRSSSSRDDRFDIRPLSRRGLQRGSGTGTGTEITDS